MLAPLVQHLASGGPAQHQLCKMILDMHNVVSSTTFAGPVKPSAEYYVAADGQEEVALQSHKKKRSGGARARSQVKVDKERLMTSTEAAATNEKLPKGFMYVPAHRLNSGAISGNE